MSYWSTHPMSGDDSLDYRNIIDFTVFTEEVIKEK